MRTRHKISLVRVGMMLAFASLLGACTKGGQFDPTTLLDNDMFDTKKPLQGQREPVFPGGVPGATTGIPQDLYKGYQPPPDETASGAATSLNPPVAEAQKPAEKPKAKAKPKPRPRVARAPEPPRASISVGLRKKPKPAAEQQAGPAQTDWPAPPSTAAQVQPPSQSVWPAPPPTGGSQQAAQPSQSIWPNPPPTGR